MIKNGYKLTIFVGDDDISTSAKDVDSTAFLIDQNNYYSFIVSTLEKDTTIYTNLKSLDSINCERTSQKNTVKLVNLCSFADRLVYVPPEKWSDSRVAEWNPAGVTLQGSTELALIKVSKKVKVDNLENNITLFVDPSPAAGRLSDGKQLWVAGCSVSHGEGVESHEKYGSLLSKEIGLPCSFLTRNGSAIDWASDQIVRADINTGDIVIFGLTQVNRLTYIHEREFVPGINIRTYDYFPETENIVPKSNLLTEDTFYKHIYAIERAINFCKKAGATLICFDILASTDNRFAKYIDIAQHKNKIIYSFPYQNSTQGYGPSLFEDIGTDGIHPGPKQHLSYKNFLIEKLKKLNAI